MNRKNKLMGLVDDLYAEILTQDREAKTTVVGTATDEQIARLKAVQAAKKELEAKAEELSVEQKNAWRDMEEAHGLDHGKRYGLNVESREIYEYVQSKSPNSKSRLPLGD